MRLLITARFLWIYFRQSRVYFGGFAISRRAALKDLAVSNFVAQFNFDYAIYTIFA